MSYTRTLQLSDFNAMASDITLDSTKRGDNVGQADVQGYTLIGRYMVPNGTRLMVGKFTGGLFFVNFLNSSNATIHGRAKIKITNPTRTRIISIGEHDTRQLNASDYANRLTQPLFRIGLTVPSIWLLENGYVELWFKPEVDGSVIDHTKTNQVILDCQNENMR